MIGPEIDDGGPFRMDLLDDQTARKNPALGVLPDPGECGQSRREIRRGWSKPHLERLSEWGWNPSPGNISDRDLDQEHGNCSPRFHDSSPPLARRPARWAHHSQSSHTILALALEASLPGSGIEPKRRNARAGMGRFLGGEGTGRRELSNVLVPGSPRLSSLYRGVGLGSGPLGWPGCLRIQEVEPNGFNTNISPPRHQDTKKMQPRNAVLWRTCIQESSASFCPVQSPGNPRSQRPVVPCCLCGEISWFNAWRGGWEST